MRKAARGLNDDFPARTSSPAPENWAQDVEGEFDSDFEAGFNPAWMVPDRSGRFYWYKKKQKAGSLSHTLQLHNGGRDCDCLQPLQIGLADAAQGSKTPPSMTEATIFKPLSIDRLAEGAGGGGHWAEVNKGACDEHTRDRDARVLKRDDSFSRMLTHSRLAGKRARESPIPEMEMLPLPSPLPPPPLPRRPQQPQSRRPLSERAKDTPRETISVERQSSVFPPSPPLSPMRGRPSDRPRKVPWAGLETLGTPEIREQMVPEMTVPKSGAVVPTVMPLPPSVELVRPEERRQPRHMPQRVWSTLAMHTKPEGKDGPADRPASEGSSPARLSSLQTWGRVTPVDGLSASDAAVPATLPPPVGRAVPGGRREAGDDTRRVSSSPTICARVDEKRAWERPVPDVSAISALPPELSLPSPRMTPRVPAARRQTPRKLGRNERTLGGDLPPPSEERFSLPPQPTLREAPHPFGYPKNKRTRDEAALASTRRPPPAPPSPLFESQEMKSAGWSEERTSTGVPFWHNRFTGQLSRHKPALPPAYQKHIRMRRF